MELCSSVEPEISHLPRNEVATAAVTHPHVGQSRVQHCEKRIAGVEFLARNSHVLREIGVARPLLVQVTHGEKYLHWRDGIDRVGRGKLLVLMPGERYHVENLAGAQGYRADLLQLHPELIAEFRRHRAGLVEDLLARSPQPQASIALDRHSSQAWTHLLAALGNDAPAALLEQQAQTLLLCLVLAGSGGALFLDRQAPLVARIGHLVRSDLAADWSVPTVAAQLGIGVSTLRRKLAAQDCSFRSILEDARLGRALESLQNTKLSIGRIASAVGYTSASRFSVRFRQRYGLSPSELRQAL
ncbi:helix-turn-helix transcriptional regulator [Lysobacter sp. CA196]|uniref:helix-turn-helix transcriptional regulator n=1 Tax=Lysobacter sp. CA196 TaxID=3455606 RepID=UPI003F8D5009